MGERAYAANGRSQIQGGRLYVADISTLVIGPGRRRQTPCMQWIPDRDSIVRADGPTACLRQWCCDGSCVRSQLYVVPLLEHSPYGGFNRVLISAAYQYTSSRRECRSQYVKPLWELNHSTKFEQQSCATVSFIKFFSVAHTTNSWVLEILPS